MRISAWSSYVCSSDLALMVFPELGLSGYSIDDLLLQRALLDDVEARLLELVEASRELRPFLLVGAPLRREGRFYNCAVAVNTVASLARRRRICPTIENFKRWFAGPPS